MQIYEYAVIYIPRDDEDKIIRDKCKVLVFPTSTLASDERTVTLVAAKRIPDEVNIDFVQVVVRPF